MITVIGIFEEPGQAEDAVSYLLANDFMNENVDIHSNTGEAGQTERVEGFFNHILDDEKEATHYASIGQQGSIVTVHAISTREAQEAVDAFNNYGAMDVNAMSSRVVERIVDADKRLRDKV